MESRVREEYFDGHFRVVIVENEVERLYSIDVYERLEEVPGPCIEWLEVDSPGRLCYLRINDNCEAVLVVTPGRVEVVNLRLRVKPSSDPYGGDARAARESCIEELQRALRSWGGKGA